MRYKIWYMRPSFISQGLMGMVPDIKNVIHTHTYVRDIYANDLDDVFEKMQGENWSPNGEASDLIEGLGLNHPSMCVGDIIVDDCDIAFIVSGMGFKELGVMHMEHRTLIGTITDKATASFVDDITKDNFKDWYDHWIKTGKDWANELEKEGLTLTAKAVRDHVKYQEDLGWKK